MHVEAPASTENAHARGQGDGLVVRLESKLPERLPVGDGTAVFVYGSCFHRRRPIRHLTLVAGGRRIRPMATGMPRRDLFEALHAGEFAADGGWAPGRDSSPEDPHGHAYRSGFWAIVPLPAAIHRDVLELSVSARLDDGTTVDAPLGRLSLEPSVPTEPVSWRNGHGSSEVPLVAVCMATYNPPERLLREQIDSIRAQTYGNWMCVIGDDCSDPARFAELEAVIGDDPRFVLSRSPRRLGIYENFERALSMVPMEAGYVALADQDDRWDPDKLEVLTSSLGTADLVYSDARVVDLDGKLVSDTYWSARRTNHTNLGSLLVSNTVTGAASLFRRELLDRVLPFPRAVGTPYHDHWIALVALATGSIAYVSRPLYDYVQHRGAAMGHSLANEAPGRRSYLERLRMLRTDPAAAFAGWRSKYFHGVCRMLVLATALDVRAGRTMGWRKRRTLRRFLTIDRSPASFAWLWLRRLRTLSGRNETLGNERLLLHGILWRRMIGLLTWRRRLPPARLSNDASMPSGDSTAPAGFVREKLAPLELEIRADNPERVNVLVPTLDLRHFFGGYIAKLNLARKLAQRGVRTRLVTVDEVGPLPRDWRDRVESQAGLGGLFDTVEVGFGHGNALDVSPRDCFVASTWWTAHRAHRALESLERERFLYLIQEYEPYTFPMGARAAIAAQSYEFPHFALFSSELLGEFFERRGVGVFAGTWGDGEHDSISFRNAITPVRAPTEAELAARTQRRLLFYARPEPNNSRNMFELGMLALIESVADGLFGDEWSFHGIGATQGWRRFDLGIGREMEVITRTDQGEYGELLGAHDVGLALMYTAHPSLVPIEMASAGMLVVTNSFENKTAEAMSRISPNLITAAPTLDGIKDGLRNAVEHVGDADRRVRGAAVDWSTDWDASLNDRVMERVARFLAAC